MTDATAAPLAAKAGVWEDFVDILHQPSVVFDRRREGQFGLALAILAVVTAILAFALHNGIAPVMDAVMAKQQAAMLAKNPNMTAEQLAVGANIGEKMSQYGSIVIVPIFAAIGAVLIWIAAKVASASIAFAPAMMISTYAGVPRVFQTVVTALQGLLLPPESFTSQYSAMIGPARFLPDSTNPFLMTFLGGFDAFTIWTSVLIAIGIAVVARVPLKKGAIVAAIVWVVVLLPGLYQALQQG